MKVQKKTFKDIYIERKQLPTHAEMFIAEVAELTHRSPNTVKMWLHEAGKSLVGVRNDSAAWEDFKRKL